MLHSLSLSLPHRHTHTPRLMSPWGQLSLLLRYLFTPASLSVSSLLPCTPITSDWTHRQEGQRGREGAIVICSHTTTHASGLSTPEEKKPKLRLSTKSWELYNKDPVKYVDLVQSAGYTDGISWQTGQLRAAPDRGHKAAPQLITNRICWKVKCVNKRKGGVETVVRRVAFFRKKKLKCELELFKILY